MMTKEKGQSLLEFLICLKAFLLFLSLCFLLIYFFYAKQVVHHNLYRGLICMETYKRSTRSCKSQIKKQVKKLLWFHKSIKVKSYKTSRGHSLVLTASAGGIKSKWKKKIKVVR